MDIGSTPINAGPTALRIGVVLHDFSGGGTERVAVRLANAWAAEGRTVTLFCGVAAGPALADVAAGVRVVEARPPVPRGRGSRQRLGRTLPVLLGETPVDVVVAPGNFHVPVLAALARAMRHNRPALIAKLSNPLRRPGHGRVRAIAFAVFARRAARRLDCVVAMAPAFAAQARDVLRHGDIATVHDPILVTGIGPTRERPVGPPLVVCAGRLEGQKNLALALRAFALLDVAGARLRLVGSGSQRGALERLAAALGIADRTEFTGHVAGIDAHLAAASLLLCTSLYETGPAVLIEALAAGVPVVTTACSLALPEMMVDASCGETAAADAPALAAAMRRVLGGGPVSAAAKATLAARYDARRSSTAWLSVLDRVAAARPRSRQETGAG